MVYSQLKLKFLKRFIEPESIIELYSDVFRLFDHHWQPQDR